MSTASRAMRRRRPSAGRDPHERDASVEVTTQFVPPMTANGVPVLALTAAQAAQALSISRNHLDLCVKRGLIPVVKLGHKPVFFVEDLRDLRHALKSGSASL